MLDDFQPTATELGPVAGFPRLPHRVELAGHTYFLVEDAGSYQLLSTACPHKGGRVADAGPVFECPKHGWQFDHRTGACLNAPGEHLTGYPVEERDGMLYALLPQRLAGTVPALRAEPPEGLTFKLHAHACLEIDYQGFSLLTDPWLVGPAFLGSWLHYPPAAADPAVLEPDAIWISHEHSDHFHPPTLEHLPRSVPVYVPDFPNRRLPQRLAELGFEHVQAMPFGETVEIAPDFRLTCFEPASLWNDAMVLMEIGGFRYLNLNDAGVNHRIASLVAPVDLVSSTFSPGASGYPMTWEHLTDAEKVEIMERARSGSVEMLRTAMDVYGAEYLLPFASYFTLWHPSHRRYLGMLRRNSPMDVVGAFAETDVQVVDLLPGETWRVLSGERTLRAEREELFSLAEIVRHVKTAWDEDEFARAYPADGTLTRDEVERYFLRLNEAPEIGFSEDLTAVVRTLEHGLEVAFEIAGGRLSLLEEAPEPPNVTIGIPEAILAMIVREDVSWDEAFLGYWCRMTRTPDVYHAAFWRLLQAPYYRKPAVAAPRVDGLGPDSAIADVLERYGPAADRVLRRYGLYCFGCHHSPFETLAQGARKHGVSDAQLYRLVGELRRAAEEPAPALEVSTP